MPLIELKNVEKSFPAPNGNAQRVFVLRQINLAIDAGEFISIMGPSGSGKTSLLNTIGMMDQDWSGEYRIADQAVHSLNAKARQALQRQHVGFIFQHYHLIDDLTVEENLDLPLSYRDVPATERKSRVADMLDRFQFVGKKNLFPRQLSGGQQQQVAVARALISNPSVLLADEPTGALHTEQGSMIMDMLVALNRQGTTIVQVTHNPEHAARASRLIRMRDGWME